MPEALASPRPRFLDAGEVATELRISRSRVYALIEAGVIPVTRFGPRRLRVPARALDQLEDRGLARWNEEEPAR